MGTWQGHHACIGEEPNGLVRYALCQYVKHKSAALDLGAGNLRDSKFLLARGFGRVVAVDTSEDSLPFSNQNIEFHQERIESFVPQALEFDLVCAFNILPFLSARDVALVFERVAASLKPGGVFVGNALGKDDQWVKEGKHVSSFTQESVCRLCRMLHLVFLSEAKCQGKVITPNGTSAPRFWHTLNFLAIKY